MLKIGVEIKVCMPKKLTCEEKALLADFERLRASRLDPLFLSQHRFGRLALPPGDKDKDGEQRDS